MNENYNVRHRLIAYSLFVGLFLQSCSGFSNNLIPQKKGSTDNILRSSKDSDINPLVGKEIVTSDGYLASFYEENGELKADLKADEEQPNPNYKGISVVIEDGTNLSSLIKGGPIIQKKQIMLNHSQSGQLRHITIRKGGLLGGMKRKSEKKEKETKKEVDEGPLNKRLKLVTKDNFLKENEEATVLGNFEDVPLEILTMIFEYVRYPYILNCRTINHFFYQSITGYNQIAPVDLTYKPKNSLFTSSISLTDKVIDLGKEKYISLTPKNISCFFFYKLVGKVKNISLLFWPFLQGSEIHTINLKGNNIKDEGIAEFTNNLQGTNVEKINLSQNKITYLGVAKFIDRLKETKVHTIDLSYNRIGDLGAIELAKSLHNVGNIIRIRRIYLSNNKITDVGALKFVKSLEKTMVHEIDFSENNISAKAVGKLFKKLQKTIVTKINLSTNELGDIGTIGIAKNLPDTKIERLYLSMNNITILGVVTLVKNLKNTNICSLNLSSNNLGDVGAVKVVKKLQGSKLYDLSLGDNNISDQGIIKLANHLKRRSIEEIDLGDNNISSTGIIEFAKILEGTNVHVVHLKNNKIDVTTAEFINKNYPHIKWGF